MGPRDPKGDSAALPRHELARAAGAAVRWRGVGLVGARILGVARSITLAWLLAPDDFGLFAMALIPLDLMMGVTDVGMVPALVQRPEISEDYFHIAWTVGILRALVVSLLVFGAASIAARWLGDPRAANIIRLAALRPMISALGSIRVAQLERELRFRSLAFVDIATALAHTSVALFLAPTLGVWALVIGMLGGAGAGVAVSFVVAPYRPRILFDAIRARQLMHFGRWLLVGGVLAMAGEAMLVASITRLAGTEALGRYSLAASLALIPAAVASSLVSGVGFAVHARVAADPDRVWRVFRANLLGMMMLIMPAYAILIAVAPRLAASALDARWHGVGGVVQLLAVAGVLGLIYDGTTAMLSGTGDPKAASMLSVIFTAIVAVLAWPLTARNGINGAAAARVAAEVGVALGSYLLIRRSLHVRPTGLALASAAVLSGSMLGAATAYLVAANGSSLIALICAGVLGLTVACVAVWAFDRIFSLGLLRDALLVVPQRWKEVRQ